jgi:hypothetical protein
MFSKHVHEVTHYETHCPKCGKPMRTIAFVLERPVIERILAHLGGPTRPPAVRPARPPPQGEFQFDQTLGPDD